MKSKAIKVNLIVTVIAEILIAAAAIIGTVMAAKDIDEVL